MQYLTSLTITHNLTEGLSDTRDTYERGFASLHWHGRQSSRHLDPHVSEIPVGWRDYITASARSR